MGEVYLKKKKKKKKKRKEERNHGQIRGNCPIFSVQTFSDNSRKKKEITIVPACLYEVAMILPS